MGYKKIIKDLKKDIKHHIDNPREIPFETFIHESVEFKVINHHQANGYLKLVTNILETEHLYDVFNDYSAFPDYDQNGFFLLAENDVEMETFSLEFENTEEINVLGVIFLKNLVVKKCIIGYDTDYSPIMAVFGNTTCPNLHLFGNIHFFQGKIHAELIWGFYNHGYLYCNNYVHAQVIILDDMRMEIGNIENVKAIVTTFRPDLYIPSEFYKDETETTKEIRMTYVVATHNVEDVLISEVLDEDKQLQQQSDITEINAVETILAGKSIIKPEFIANDFYVKFPETIQEKLLSVFQLPKLKSGKNRTIINKFQSFVFEKITNDDNDQILQFYLFDSNFHYSLSVTFNQTLNNIKLEYEMYKEDNETTFACYQFPTDSSDYIANSVKNTFENCYKTIMNL